MNRFFRPNDRPLLNLALLLVTAATTFGAFLVFFGSEGTQAEQIDGALTFSGCLLLILGCHEMGHYVFARLHGVDTSLPYFIPFPFGVGTLGAVIRIRGRIPHRNALVDIGAAGPLAGLAVAIPLLAFGLAHSGWVDSPPQAQAFPPDGSLWAFGRELIHFIEQKWSHAAPSSSAVVRGNVTIFGDNLLIVGLRRLVLGPLPEGKDVAAHPAVIAGWFGLLVTMLNLVPIGQLDGGHVSYALFGPRATWVGKISAVVLLVLTVFGSAGLLVWLFVATKFIGFRHPELLEPQSPLSRSRKVVSALCLIGLVLCLMPTPITVVNT